MSFDVKADIMKAINGTDDPAMRTVFMLMLGLFESFNEKLDKVIGDEKAMREAVLNGHEPVHHSHHEWIDRQIKSLKSIMNGSIGASSATRRLTQLSPGQRRQKNARRTTRRADARSAMA